MKRLVIFLLGLTPFLFGELLNWGMLHHAQVDFPLLLISVVLLAVWFFYAFFSSRLAKNTVAAVILLGLPAVAVLVLLGIQELVLHAYWPNLVGIWTQLFYLPFLSVGFRLTTWSQSMFAGYAATFIVLTAVSVLGGLAGNLGQAANKRITA